MGWLRELMDGASPPIRSYGRLARSILAAEDWPAEQSIQARSLAGVFSKLDRERDLGWLSDRPEMQVALARALQASVEEVRRALRRQSQDDLEGNRLRLDDLRYARALELRSEPLCPGLPGEALSPSTWRLSFWIAPSGAGRSLVGRWLQARGLAEFVRVTSWQRTWPDLHAQSLAGGRDGASRALPLFVELEASCPSPPWREVAMLGRPVCVAGALAPEPLPGDGGWHVFRSPAPDTYVEALVEWVQARLPARAESGDFDATRVCAWLAGEPIGSGAAATLGTLLGLCGLADELGVRAVQNRRLRELAEWAFRRHIVDARDRSEDGVWLRRAGYGALIGLLGQCLTEGEEPWEAMRTFERWLELVPPELQRSPDLEWMKLALSETGTRVGPESIDRAARRLPPGPFRVLRAFERVGVLRRSDFGTGLVLRPHWLGAIGSAIAFDEAMHGPALGWGEAVLQTARADRVLDALTARLREGDAGLIEDVLELGDSPAEVAAVEAAFVALGVTALERGEPPDVPPDLLIALWNEALRLTVDVPGQLPHRRIAWRPSGASGFLSSEAAYHLAALTLGEELPDAVGTRHDLLRPWLRAHAAPELVALLDGIRDALLASTETPAWATATFALVGRLRRAVGPLRGEGAAPHALERPELVLEDIERGSFHWSAVRALADFAPSVRGLIELSSGRVAREALTDELWKAWERAGCPPGGVELFGLCRQAGLDPWPSIPLALFKRLLRDERAFDLPYTALGIEHWRAAVEAEESFPHLFENPAACRAVPEEMAEHLLARPELGLSQEALRVLWERFPKLLLVTLRKRRDGDRGEGFVDMLLSAPDASTAEIVATLAQRGSALDLPESSLHGLRQWLYARVMQRTPGWREAYALLSNIENELVLARGGRREDAS